MLRTVLQACTLGHDCQRTSALAVSIITLSMHFPCARARHATVLPLKQIALPNALPFFSLSNLNTILILIPSTRTRSFILNFIQCFRFLLIIFPDSLDLIAETCLVVRHSSAFPAFSSMLDKRFVACKKATLLEAFKAFG